MLSEEDYRQELGREGRRARGVFFTPAPLVAYVVAETMAGPLLQATWREDGSPRLRILDPAAGSGRFLAACAEKLADEAARRGVARDAARAAIVRRCLTGVERDPSAAALARRALGDGADVRVAEALLSCEIPEGAWDVVVGNPPYVRSVTLRRVDPRLWQALRGRFSASSHGEWDLYGVFLERALSWVRPGGEIGLVLPSRWLTGGFARPLRELLAETRVVRKIVDFGARQLFAGATTYVALVFLSDASHPAIDVARCIADDPAKLSLPPEPGWASGSVSAETLSGAPWRLAFGATARLLDCMGRAGPTLGSMARIAKGAGTNADSVFLLDAKAQGEVEDELLVPCVRGRDIRPYEACLTRRALLPYATGRLISWAEMTSRWPRAAAYLRRRQAILEGRERGRFAGDAFHCWGRPQNLRWLCDPLPKVIVPDAAGAARAVLDTAGWLAIDTAYAIRPHDPNRVSIGLFLAVLNSPVVLSWLRTTGILLRGGYVRMKTAYLASLPIPDPDTAAARAVATDALAVRAGDEAAIRDLGERVASLYGVTREQL